MAHEINNSTHSLLELLFLLEAAAEINATHPAHVYLENAEDEVRRISHIARAVIDSEVSDESVQSVNIQQLLSSVIRSYRSRLELRNVSVLARFRCDGSCIGYLEPLRQLFSNLLMNAADAVPSGGKILVRTRNAAEGRQTRGTLVTIGDNGKGIPTENLSRIWSPYFGTKGTGGGMGIGLSLVKRAVEEHHGVVRVRSSTKQGRSGTVFTIFLPSAAA